ncbi:Signal recognition particle GTPase [Vibrio sinaloensis DSM 21326]|uniref:Signal recognition particle GTPase n=1 Tax=Vibrio sinaloensis DSM 21326 TaxID=945550 RepID=E8M421_PHOS4|nr:insulinase family protein [Vibrio sinaloensis]EGA71273.1 Signal recognition particle GTPase [Vibrio sinaloensis DSM 21326]
MSKPLRQIFAVSLAASILFTPFYAVSAHHEQNDASWFQYSDIALPKGTKLAQLDNQMRYVLLPTSRNTPSLSIRVRLAVPGAQSHAIAAALFESTNWKVIDSATQSVVSQDFSEASDKTLHEALNQLADILKSEQASGTYTPALTTIVVAGNLNLRNSITAVEKTFSDWKPSLGYHLVASEVVHTQPESEQAAKPNVSLTAFTQLLDSQDSKQQRKKLLKATIANKILENRLKQALADKSVDIKVSSKVLKNVNLISQVAVISEDYAQALEAQELVKQELKRAKAGGFDQAEYELVVAQLRSDLEQQTRRFDDNYTAHQADRLVDAIDEGRVYTSPSYDLELMNFHVAHLTEFDISKEFGIIWQKPMEMVSGPNS